MLSRIKKLRFLGDNTNNDVVAKIKDFASCNV